MNECFLNEWEKANIIPVQREVTQSLVVSDLRSETKGSRFDSAANYVQR